MRSTKLRLEAVARAVLTLCFSAVLVSAMAGAAFAGRASRDGSPEIDPGSIASAVTLFAGGVMYVTSRRRAR